MLVRPLYEIKEGAANFPPPNAEEINGETFGFDEEKQGLHERCHGRILYYNGVCMIYIFACHCDGTLIA